MRFLFWSKEPQSGAKKTSIDTQKKTKQKAKENRDFSGDKTGRLQKIYSVAQGCVAGASVFVGSGFGIFSWLATPVELGGIGIGISLSAISIAGMSIGLALSLVLAGFVGWWFYHDYIDGANQLRARAASENRRYLIRKQLLKETYLLHFLASCRRFYRNKQLSANIEEEIRKLKKQKKDISKLQRLVKIINFQKAKSDQAQARKRENQVVVKLGLQENIAEDELWFIPLLEMDQADLERQLRQLTITRVRAKLRQKLIDSGLSNKEADRRMSSKKTIDREIINDLGDSDPSLRKLDLPEEVHIKDLATTLFTEEYFQPRSTPQYIHQRKIPQTILNGSIVSAMFFVTIFGIGYGSHTTLLTVSVGLGLGIAVLSSTNLITLGILAAAIVLGLMFGLTYAYFKYRNLQREERVANLEEKNRVLYDEDYRKLNDDYKIIFGTNLEKQDIAQKPLSSNLSKEKEKGKGKEKEAKLTQLPGSTVDQTKPRSIKGTKRQSCPSLLFNSGAVSDDWDVSPYQQNWGSHSMIEHKNSQGLGKQL